MIKLNKDFLIEKVNLNKIQRNSNILSSLNSGKVHENSVTGVENSNAPVTAGGLSERIDNRLRENVLKSALAAGMISSAALAAPPKKEAIDMIMPFVKEKEGFRAKAERDQNAPGKPFVIGYGTTDVYPDGTKIQPSDTITPEKAEEHVKSFIGKMGPNLEKIPGWDEMSSGQQAALLSFGYNFGSDFYRPKAGENESFYSISQDLKDKNWENVPNTLKLYNKGTDPKTGKRIVLGGLVKRREQEGKMWSSTDSETKPEPTEPAEASNQSVTTEPAEHLIGKGDTLYAVAKKYGTTVNDIMAKNPNIKDASKIQAGQKIKIK